MRGGRAFQVDLSSCPKQEKSVGDPVLPADEGAAPPQNRRPLLPHHLSQPCFVPVSKVAALALSSAFPSTTTFRDNQRSTSFATLDLPGTDTVFRGNRYSKLTSSTSTAPAPESPTHTVAISSCRQREQLRHAISPEPHLRPSGSRPNRYDRLGGTTAATMPPSSTQKALATQFVQLTGASDRTAQRVRSSPTEKHPNRVLSRSRPSFAQPPRPLPHCWRTPHRPTRRCKTQAMSATYRRNVGCCRALQRCVALSCTV